MPSAHLQPDLAIRPFRPGDERDVLLVHWDAVHNIASADYEQTVLDAWSGPVDATRIDLFKKNQSTDSQGEVILVAELRGQIVGFGSIVPSRGELRAIYVSSGAKRCGVGTAILNELEQVARERGIQELHMDASVTAEAFYRARGYEPGEYAEHAFANGISMRCVKMRKRL